VQRHFSLAQHALLMYKYADGVTLPDLCDDVRQLVPCYGDALAAVSATSSHNDVDEQIRACVRVLRW